MHSRSGAAAPRGRLGTCVRLLTLLFSPPPRPLRHRPRAQLVAAWKKAAAESGGSLDVPSEAVLANLISEADQDGDGQLSEDEFFSLVEQCS